MVYWLGPMTYLLGLPLYHLAIFEAGSGYEWSYGEHGVYSVPISTDVVTCRVMPFSS